MKTDIENHDITEIECEFTENSTMNFEDICDSDGDVNLDALDFDEAVRQRQLEEEIQKTTYVSFIVNLICWKFWL